MTLSIRSKLFITSFSLLLLGGIPAGLWLEQTIDSHFQHLLEERLGREATLIQTILPTQKTATHLDALADQMGEAAQARVSLIGPGGKLLGDSWIDEGKLSGVENHQTRPEVLAALAKGRGVARRKSNTVGPEMTYVAIALNETGPISVIRLAAPLSEVDEALQKFRQLMWLAALLAFLVTLFMSGLASRFLSQTLQELVNDARGIAQRGSSKHRAIESLHPDRSLTGPLIQIHHEMEEVINTLAQERDRFEAVLDGMDEAVIALDKVQRITLLNEQAAALLNLKTSPLGKSLLEVVRVPELQELAQATVAAEGREVEFSLMRGSKRQQVLARGTPQRTGDGSVLVMQDVTDLRHLERMRADFVANVSHELRTPVHIIQTNAETLMNGAINDPEACEFFLNALQRNAKRLSRLIADLLDISRLEAGIQTLKTEEIDLRLLGDRVLEDLSQPAEAKGIRLENLISSNIVVLGDDKALEQVLHNLIENAIKYTDEQDLVQLQCLRIDDTIRIEVKDNGPGVPPQHRGRLFERFYRVDPGRSRAMGGTGLGLAIVKHLVVTMGGEVGMRPAEGKGSIFWAMLPAKPGNKQP